MLYLVSFTTIGGDMVYARSCDNRADAINAMREANPHNSEQYYADAIGNYVIVAASKGQQVYSTRIVSNIVLTIITP